MLKGLLPQRQDENEKTIDELPSLASTSSSAPPAPSPGSRSACASHESIGDATHFSESSAEASISSTSWEELAEEEQRPLVASSLKWLVWVSARHDWGSLGFLHRTIARPRRRRCFFLNLS